MKEYEPEWIAEFIYPKEERPHTKPVKIIYHDNPKFIGTKHHDLSDWFLPFDMKL